jgi:hypothetical protein
MTGAVVLCCSALAAGVALAQSGNRTLEGVVIDSIDHKPVAQVAIYLGRTDTGERTAKDGTFSVSAAEEPVMLAARRPGYVPGFVPVPADTAGSETNLDTVRLRKVKTDADRAAVQQADVRMFPELAEFYDHKAKYHQGLFYAPDELERRGGTVVDLIREKPNFHFVCVVDRRGQWDCGQHLNRGRTSILRGNPGSAEQEPCPLGVWTNGRDVDRPLAEIVADQVLAIEAYPNPGATPEAFAGSSCATIMLYMKQVLSEGRMRPRTP